MLHVCHACCNYIRKREAAWCPMARYQRSAIISNFWSQVDSPAKYMPILLDQELGKIPGDRAGIATSCLQYRSNSKCSSVVLGSFCCISQRGLCHQNSMLLGNASSCTDGKLSISLCHLGNLMQRSYTYTGKWKGLSNDKVTQARHSSEAIHGRYGAIQCVCGLCNKVLPTFRKLYTGHALGPLTSTLSISTPLKPLSLANFFISSLVPGS